MKAQPLCLHDGVYSPCKPQEATHVRLHLPGPLPNRIVPVRHLNTVAVTRPSWAWNGSVDLPTLSPSLLSAGSDVSGDHLCHSFIRAGRVQFLSDCSHSLAGQTVDLLDVD